MDAQAYGFVVEWYDAQADLMREYTLTVYAPQRGPLEVAMYDPKGKRSFLKRVAMPEFRLEDFGLGKIVTLYARQLKVKDYGDERTRSEFEAKRGTFGVIIAPAAFGHLGKIISGIENAGLTMNRLRLVNEGGPLVALQVMGDPEAERRWLAATSPMPPGAVQKVSSEEVQPYFDPRRYPTTAAFDHCTLGVVRPHAVRAGHVGEVLTAVAQAGLEISALRMLHLQRPEAAEFLEVYKGVLPYQPAMVESLCAAPCVAFELRAPEDAVERFRKLCGPHDVDMARHLRPESLRARFGLDNAQNGVHATDLEEDAVHEVRYIFQLLGG